MAENPLRPRQVGKNFGKRGDLGKDFGKPLATWEPGDPVYVEVNKVNVCRSCGTSWTADVNACPSDGCAQFARNSRAIRDARLTGHRGRGCADG